MDLGENFRARVRIARFGSQGGTHEHKQLRIGLAPSRRNETRERRPEGVEMQIFIRSRHRVETEFAIIEFADD